MTLITGDMAGGTPASARWGMGGKTCITHEETPTKEVGVCHGRTRPIVTNFCYSFTTHAAGGQTTTRLRPDRLAA